MKTLLLVPTMLMAACATTGGAGGGGKVAPFPGQAAVEKRRAELDDAAKGAMECLKVKPGEQPAKGGVFAVVADATGKVKVDAIKFDGPDAVKQCIVDTGNKTTVSAMPGPNVGTLWEFLPPGEKPTPPKTPDDFGVKMQPLAETMQAQVVECGRRHLGVDFGATIDVAYYLYNNGQAYAPTVLKSDAKDGSFEACVQDVILTTKFPTESVDKPFGATAHFKIGVYGDVNHKG
jgi:hypothetical protein